MIKKLPNDLPARFERPDGSRITMKSYTEEHVFKELAYSYDLIAKINELVDAVNTMRKDDKK